MVHMLLQPGDPFLQQFLQRRLLRLLLLQQPNFSHEFLVGLIGNWNECLLVPAHRGHHVHHMLVHLWWERCDCGRDIRV